MNAEEFQTMFDTLELDTTHRATDSIRATRPGPTVVFGGLPSVNLGANTDPEFELGATIGEGGMGVVRTARQLALHREVAVKTLRPDRRSESARGGLLHEAFVTGGLEHPSIVPVYTLGQTGDGQPVIVMKRIEGVPWTECIEDFARAPSGGGGEESMLWHLQVFERVCQAVHFAHSKGIIHRDIKPENVMIGSFGEVYLVDWGVAATTDDAKASFLLHIREANGICGTPAYMAPEMTIGRGDELSIRTDVYLLGATLFHVLTGRPPHSGRTLFEIMYAAHESRPPEFGPEIPSELVEIVRRAMAKKPSERFESADAVRRALSEFERHRTSVLLADEALERLAELRAAVDAEHPDDALVRGLAGECRFGFEQALRVWPENKTAVEHRDAVLTTLGRWELASGNLRSAETLCSQLSAADEAFAAEIEAVREVVAARDADVAQLRQFHEDLDISAGAKSRALAAFTAVLFWTFIPLTAGLWARQGWAEVSVQNFLIHGFVVLAFLTTMVFALRRQLLQNEANRRIIQCVMAFALWLPFYRFIVVATGVLDVPTALALELGTYGLVIAAIGILSGRLPVFEVVVYLVCSAFAVQHTEWVYELVALANLLAVGSLGAKWLNQRETSVE